ncbi:MAG: zf-HC2 domain-containing protein [Verrucomicrobia bacterium]|nr:zf-HC2 domain-containing protein [Verrucomicrobiota bacterium]MBU1908993.1 zf-HC2 domain-containing protein [Verrucomicrobiota bacterium]
MNCEAMKNRALLDQSGELSWWGRRRLESHLARCADCRAFRNELLRLTDAVRSVHWDESFDARLAGRIAAAAPGPSAHTERRRERFNHLSWHPALAYSALSVLLALAFVLVLRPFHRTGTIARVTPDAEVEIAWDVDLDDRIATLDSLLNRADLDWSDTETAAAENGDLDSIATQLLALEGEQI